MQRSHNKWKVGRALVPWLLTALFLGSGWGFGPVLARAQNPPLKKPEFREAPPIETKVRQVPGEGSFSVPLWKQHWELARKAVLQKEIPQAVAAYRQALALKPNLDEARLELVRILESGQRYEEAAAELEVFVEHQPHNLKAQQELGDLLTLRKEYRRAADWYQRILQRTPENLAIRLSLAAVYNQINETEKAMIEWRQVLLRDPQHYDARLNLAEGLRATRRYDESIQLLEGLVRQYPRQPVLKKKLAQSLMAAQRGKEALPYLQELNRLDPGDLEIQLQIAQVLSAGKQYDQSLPYLETYLKKRPENPGALLEKARILLHKGQVNEAFETYDQLKKMEPKNRDLQREIAEAYYAQGKSAEALAGFEALLEYFPQDERLLEKLSRLYLQKKDYPRAIQTLERSLAIDPEGVYAQLGLARAYNMSGQKEKAVPYYQSLLKKRDHPEIKLELADLFLEIGQPGDAFPIYEELLRENPRLWTVRYRWATALYRQKEYTRASEQLETLIETQPRNSGIWTLLGYNALDRGDWKRAQEAFRQVLSLGEDRGNILMRLGIIYRLQGRPHKALSYLDWAQTLKTNEREIPVQRVLALIDGGNYALARKIIEPLLGKNPADFLLQWSYSRLLLALDRKEEFIVLNRRLEQEFPGETARLYLDRAVFFARRGQPAVEYAVLREARLKNPQDLEIRRRIGHWLIREKKWAEAEAHYQELVQEKALLDESYLSLGLIQLSQGHPEAAGEYFWKTLAADPDSVAARVWLSRLDLPAGGRRFRSQVEKSVLQFARSQDMGLLELADIEAGENNWEKAEGFYREIMELGEDDEVLQAALRTARRGIARQRYESTELFLEDLQKRFPRNQRITRDLILTYSLNKSYAEAIRQIDGLLKIEDPLDPVLNIKKAQLLEKWHKHEASQKIFASLLKPAVDQLLWDRLQAWPWQPKPDEMASLKAVLEQRDPQSIFSFYEMFSSRSAEVPLDPETRVRLGKLLQDLEAQALIQKKVYLEMEGKDMIWRGQLMPARAVLEKLQALDPENEDVNADLERSHRLEP
jgi:tetratricopeptide (TPR) repeat protein